MTDKHFSLVRPSNVKANNKNPKSCVNCDQLATKEIVYTIGNELSVVEGYCVDCAPDAVQQLTGGN